jgi:hydrogenase maturation protease
MACVLVLALGNPLRGDDGIGSRAAQHLSAVTDGATVEIVPCHQLTPELVERVGGAQRVIFVDAAVDVPPGEVRSAAIQAEARPCGVLSHHLTPSLLLGYTKSLLGRCPEAFQVSIGGRSFGYSERLSAEVEAGYPELIARIEDLCRNAPCAVRLRESAHA